MYPFEYKPISQVDQAFLRSKEGEWTLFGFIFPSGTVMPNPFPGMIWMVVEGKLMMLREPVEV